MFGYNKLSSDVLFILTRKLLFLIFQEKYPVVKSYTGIFPGRMCFAEKYHFFFALLQTNYFRYEKIIGHSLFFCGPLGG